MEKFDWTQFRKRVYINSDLISVYDAWTKSQELEKWILSSSIFRSESNHELKPSDNVHSNSTYCWSWFAQNHSETGIVIEANGIDVFSFSFAGKCIVHVNLKQENDQVLVELIQSNIPLDESSKQNIRIGCALGWTFYLTNLKSILEGGIDLRNKDTNLVGVVNN